MQLCYIGRNRTETNNRGVIPTAVVARKMGNSHCAGQVAYPPRKTIAPCRVTPYLELFPLWLREYLRIAMKLS
jgi:hypothetical protein